MNEFLIFLQMGFQHICDVKGYDHMLFILVLYAGYSYKEWKKLIILISAFTIGHSISLALSVFKVILVNKNAVEILIAVTILATSIGNLIFKDKNSNSTTSNFSYIIALIFGFIHGIGFSSFFNELMGDMMQITLPLFAFNVGLELGQLLILLLLFLTYFFINKIRPIQQRSWTILISGAGIGVSLLMILERIKL